MDDQPSPVYLTSLEAAAASGGDSASTGSDALNAQTAELGQVLST